MNSRIRFIVVEEWGDKNNPYKYYWAQVSAQVFETRKEADEDASKREPAHDGGLIRVRPELQDRAGPKGTVSRRRGRPRDMGRR